MVFLFRDRFFLTVGTNGLNMRGDKDEMGASRILISRALGEPPGTG